MSFAIAALVCVVAVVLVLCCTFGPLGNEPRHLFDEIDDDETGGS